MRICFLYNYTRTKWDLTQLLPSKPSTDKPTNKDKSPELSVSTHYLLLSVCVNPTLNGGRGSKKRLFNSSAVVEARCHQIIPSLALLDADFDLVLVEITVQLRKRSVHSFLKPSIRARSTFI